MELSSLIAQNLEDTPSKLVDLQLFLDNINSGSGLGGTNYVFVRGDGTPQENAIELQAKYDAACALLQEKYAVESLIGKTLHVGDFITEDFVTLYKVVQEFTFDGDFAALSTEIAPATDEEFPRATVIVAPGEYTFATPFTVDTPYINIVSLTGNSDVILNGINVTADNVHLKGINCGTYAFTIGNGLNELICENCIGGEHSFGGGGIASGTFSNCTGGLYSFGGDSGTASGTFNYCTGGDGSFGGVGGTASGTFNYCTGGDSSLGGGGIASGTFSNCTGGNFSFGTTASGTFTNCIGGDGSFGGEQPAGGGDISSTGRLYYCRLTSGVFTTPAVGGKLVLCIDGTDAIVTTA